MKPMSKSLMQLTLLVGIFLLSSSANAWNSFGRWSGTRITMHAAQSTFPAGNPYRTSLYWAVMQFNKNPSQFRITQRYDDTSLDLHNGQNEVWASADRRHSPAVTYWWIDTKTNRIIEADVVFYNAYPYTAYMNKTTSLAYGGSKRTFRTVLLHEYGHVAGLHHEDDEYNIMGDDKTHIHCNGDNLYSYVGEDAADGLVYLYGGYSGTIEDLSVSMFRRIGASGGYSSHGFCRMFDSSGTLLISSDYEGQKRYDVSPGQLVRVEFTYENNGKTSQSTQVGYYISTNNYISTSDRLITRLSRMTLIRNDVYTYSVTLRIPSDLAPGTYYLGAIIDYNDTLKEIDPTNAAYHIIRVR
jgi:hypothetical protein